MTNRSFFKKASLMSKKIKFAKSYYKEIIKNIYKISWESNELDNFTYSLTDMNKKYLASYISVITGTKLEDNIKN